LHRPSAHTLIACPDCDLLQHVAIGQPGSDLLCRRCGATLRKSRSARSASHDGVLALAIAGLILLVLANSFPLAALSVQGQSIETTLPDAIAALWSRDLRLLAALVAFTTIIAPAAELLALTYVLAHRRRGRLSRSALRWLHALDEWSMTEVFMLGALVALVKLGDYAQVHFGIALWCLGGAMFLLIAASLHFDREDAWSAWERTA